MLPCNDLCSDVEHVCISDKKCLIHIMITILNNFLSLSLSQCYNKCMLERQKFSLSRSFLKLKNLSHQILFKIRFKIHKSFKSSLYSLKP